MTNVIEMRKTLEMPFVSPYLLRPIRTREQAMADIAKRRAAERRDVVMLDVPAPAPRRRRVGEIAA